jgi:nicotinic acid mononucleotide adenylyltransferase
VTKLPQEPAVFYLPFVQQPISSSAIREDRKRGERVSQWLPPDVWSYIEKNKLYS